MQNLIIKIKKALAEIEAEKGEFILKCLVAKDPDDILWDLVLVADWFDKDEMKRLTYLSEKIFRDFDTNCMSQFSAIITIKKTSDVAIQLMEIRSKYKNIYPEGTEFFTGKKELPMVVLLGDAEEVKIA